MSGSGGSGKLRVLIAGGGVAGLEALLALSKMAGDRIELTLLAPEPDFVYKPLLVEEPFAAGPAERHELAPIAEENGASLVRGSLSGVRTEEQIADLADGSELPYDALLVCVGGRFSPAFEQAVTFPGPEPLEIDQLVKQAVVTDGSRVAFVVPPRVAWPLPIYELALMTERRARELGEEVEIVVVTPESSPLILFGTSASEAVTELLSGRGIAVEAAARVRKITDGALVLAPGDRRLDAGAVVALPDMKGPRIAGLPSDERGFIPIDEHAQVKGTADVYAAGDGTNFPIKQGGLGTQQADAAAEEIASRAGAKIEPEPFHPILRGMLLTGDESISMQKDITGGAGEGSASPDWLWWPPQKIGGRFLAAWLGHEEPHDLEPPRRPLSVEIALPKEWHEQPMALDPYGTASRSTES